MTALTRKNPFLTRQRTRFFPFYSFFTLLASLSFYLFFCFYDGAVICVDSPSYIDMSFIREPLYPLFLAFFRLFDRENYLFFAVIAQSCLTAVSGWALADFLRKKLSLPPLYGILLYLMPLCTSLLCRFAAKRASMYSNSILSEGLAIPLYWLFFLFLTRFVLEKYRSSFFFCCVLAFLMVSVRKQMFMALPLLVIAVLYVSLREKKAVIGIFFSLAACVLIVLAFRLFDCSYNYVLRGEFQGHSSDNRFVTTMVFYNARPEHADYIDDLAIRELFLEIYARCDEAGYLGSHAGEGWLNQVSHFGDHYDHIQIDTMWPMIEDYSRKSIGETEDELLYSLETDRINSVIIRSVLPRQLPELIKSTFNNFLSGLITTVAQRTPLLIYYTAGIYLLYFLLLGRLLAFLRKTPSPSCSAPKAAAIFAALVLLGILFNVGLVSVVIFCQARYTIYNMPLFYQGGIVLLYANFQLSRQKRK